MTEPEVREDVFEITYAGFATYMKNKNWPCPSKEMILEWVRFCAKVFKKVEST